MKVEPHAPQLGGKFDGVLDDNDLRLTVVTVASRQPKKATSMTKRSRQAT